MYAPDPESPAFQQLAETRLHQLDYLDATVAANLLPQALQQYVRPRAESNSIAITAPAPILDQVVAALEQLDVVPTQFLLESRVMVFEEGSIDELGVRWAWPGVRAGTFSSDARHGGDAPNRGSAWPWGIEIGYAPGGEFTNGLLAPLEALVVDDRASIIANPRLMAQNGEEAVIQVTTEEYFEVLTQGFYTSSQLEKIESGTTLTIVPTMGDDGRIMLRIEAEVSDVVARGENNLPVVSRRITRNSVWIEDGGTATIAGWSTRANARAAAGAGPRADPAARTAFPLRCRGRFAARSRHFHHSARTRSVRGPHHPQHAQRPGAGRRGQLPDARRDRVAVTMWGGDDVPPRRMRHRGFLSLSMLIAAALIAMLIVSGSIIWMTTGLVLLFR